MNSIMNNELTKLKTLNGYATLKTNNPNKKKQILQQKLKIIFLKIF